ncbi:MAG: arginine repressor [Oscillospiraceae bacterium]|nr:arginine repressor [Oscillospiraceae bacterium]
MKPGRQNLILEIINEQDIETQHQLLKALAERGIKSTQATLSRDIKDMRLIKQMGANGHYRYAVSTEQINDELAQKLRTIFRESVTSFDVAQNLLIIKTLPSLAPAACSAIEAMKDPALVGALAGHDTAFLALKDTQAAEKLRREIESILSH